MVPYTFHPVFVQHRCHYTVNACYNNAREAMTHVAVFAENVLGDTILLSASEFLSFDEDYKLLKYNVHVDDAEWATFMENFMPPPEEEKNEL